MDYLHLSSIVGDRFIVKEFIASGIYQLNYLRKFWDTL